MQLIFQDPFGSLNPRRRVGSIIGDPFAIHGGAEGRERMRQVQDLMELVGLNAEHYNRFPSEFSGGQRQRIGIARALALRPELRDLRRAGLGARRLDPGADREPARRPAGRARADLRVHRARPLGRPPRQRPHRRDVPRQDRRARRRRGAVRAPAASRTPRRCSRRCRVADPDVADSRRRILLTGDVPSPIDPPSGCRFHPRCPKARAECSRQRAAARGARRRSPAPHRPRATSRSRPATTSRRAAPGRSGGAS